MWEQITIFYKEQKPKTCTFQVTLAQSILYNFTQMDEVMPVVERMVMFVFTSLMKLTLTLNLISKQQIQFQLQLRNICDSIIVPVFT